MHQKNVLFQKFLLQFVEKERKNLIKPNKNVDKKLSQKPQQKG